MTYFALKGGVEDGYWKSYFTAPGTTVTRVDVTTAMFNEDEASEAKVYIGDKLCCTFPSDVKRSKVYSFTCNTAGDYVQIVTGRDDKKLAFANVEVHANDNF